MLSKPSFLRFLVSFCLFLSFLPSSAPSSLESCLLFVNDTLWGGCFMTAGFRRLLYITTRKFHPSFIYSLWRWHHPPRGVRRCRSGAAATRPLTPAVMYHQTPPTSMLDTQQSNTLNVVEHSLNSSIFFLSLLLLLRLPWGPALLARRLPLQAWLLFRHSVFGLETQRPPAAPLSALSAHVWVLLWWRWLHSSFRGVFVFKRRFSGLQTSCHIFKPSSLSLADTREASLDGRRRSNKFDETQRQHEFWFSVQNYSSTNLFKGFSLFLMWRTKTKTSKLTETSRCSQQGEDLDPR